MSDEISEEEERRITAKILGGSTQRVPKVEVRRSGRKRPEPVELRFINCVESYDGEWAWCEVEQKMSSGWVKLETFEDKKRAERAAEKYQRNGDTVSWWRREI
ncbi:hypothetical protein [Rhizobium nepotum]|uniref:hypothetical protein n=1 Tax=Rhizobium nepotum TaxID=1035271 RepID=UPI003CF32D57